MKRTFLLFAFVFVLCAIICGCTLSDNVENNIYPDDNAENYIYPDYPLIEYYFDTNDDWCVVIIEDIYGENKKFYINDNEESLNFNKEKFVVNTFPAGRGTTGENEVWLVKNDELLKRVECSDFSFSSENFKKDFVEYSLEDVKKFGNLKL